MRGSFINALGSLTPLMETPTYELMNEEVGTNSETSPRVERIRAFSVTRVLPYPHSAQNMDEHGYVDPHPRIPGYSPLND